MSFIVFLFYGFGPLFLITLLEFWNIVLLSTNVLLLPFHLRTGVLRFILGI
jgi:hypothetical protein